MIGADQVALLPQSAVIVNTARGHVLDLAAVEAGLRSGRLAGAELDVIPVEPPVEPVPELLRAYRARESGWKGALRSRRTAPLLLPRPMRTSNANQPRRCAPC